MPVQARWEAEVNLHQQPERGGVVKNAPRPLYPPKLKSVVEEAAWALGRWTACKTTFLPGFDPRIVQPVASHHTV
jgi:hypothetical protein